MPTPYPTAHHAATIDAPGIMTPFLIDRPARLCDRQPMFAAYPAALARAPILGGSPTQALLDLGRLVREAIPYAIMTADLQADRGLDDPRAALEATLAGGEHAGEERRTRVIGPASGGLVQGPGGVALVGAIGPLAARIAAAIGPELGLAIDLGLAWVLAAHELVPGLIESGMHTLGLALEPAAYRPLARILREAQGRVAIFALAPSHSVLAQSLAAYGVACVADLGALARALATPPSERPRGTRIAVVTGTGPLASFVAPAFEAAGLRLARPSQATLAHLESELPAQTRTTTFIQIPGATQRHAALAVESLRADFLVAHVFAFDLPGFPPRDPMIEAAHLAALATAATSIATPPSPLPAEPAQPPRAETLVAAALLMRRVTLDRESCSALLTALAPELKAAPVFAVASLAAAHNAARRSGYPVMLGSTPLADETALTRHWEALLAGLVPSEAPYDRRSADPFAAHVIQRAPATQTELHYSATPLPRVTVSGSPQTIALPARQAELALVPRLAHALVALSRLSARAPEVATLELVLGGSADNGDTCVIIDASATLVAAAGAESR